MKTSTITGGAGSAAIAVTLASAFVLSTIAQAAIPLHGFKGDMGEAGEKFVALDINGDGKTDVLVYRPGKGYAGVYLSNGDGGLRYVEYSRPDKQSNGFRNDVKGAADTAVALDINGDGKSDILWYSPGAGYAGVYLSRGDGTLDYVEYSRPNAAPSHGFLGDVASTNGYVDRAVALDINGDGKSDFLWYRPGAGYAGVYLSKGDGTVQYLEYKNPGTAAVNGFTSDVMSSGTVNPAAIDIAVPLDINGDGKSDFLWYRPGAGYAGVYLSLGDGKLQYIEYKQPGRPASNGFPGDVSFTDTFVDKAVVLDINGDGKSDFLWYRPGAGYAGVCISNGNGTLRYVDYSASSNGFTGDVKDAADTAVALDINGDGKSDFLWYRPGKGYAGVYVANSDGSGKVTYTGYSDPNQQANGFSFDVKSAQDTAVALHLQGKRNSDFLWLRPGGGYAAACFSTGNASLQCLSYEGSTETWMADLSDQIGKVQLKGIAIPGTHDSAMYQLIDGDISKNQEDDFAAQLKAGVRWLDFRMGYYAKKYPDLDIFASEMDGSTMSCFDWNKPTDPGYYMYGHSNICTKNPVSDVLDTIKTFLDTHPKEIVFLGLNAYTGASKTADFAKLLEDHLSPYIYKSGCTTRCNTEGAPPNLTPEYLWSTNQRAILIFTGFGDLGNTDEVWPMNMVATPKGYSWPNGIQGDADYQLSFMQSDMDSVRPAWRSYDSATTMLQLSAPLTPGGAEGGIGCLGQPCLDPIGLARWLNPLVVSKIQGDWTSRALNVVTVDYVSCCGIAEAIINFNNQQWVPAGSSANDIGAGKGGSVWKIDNSGAGPDFAISFFNGSGWYTAANKRAVRIAVDPAGLPWVIDSAKMIWRLKASSLALVQAGRGGDIWESMPGAAQDLGIGADGSVWVIGSTGALFKFNGSNWDQLAGDGAGRRIAVDNSGRPVVVGTDDRGIWRHDGEKWAAYTGGDFVKALDIGAGADGSIWVAGTDADSVGGVWRWNGAGWDRFRGAGTNVAVDSNGSPWVTTAEGNLWQGRIR